jgi:D-amino-acid dehydrogenase
VRVAVIGAGIVGATTAHELALDAHEVTVFERHAAVASEASFANAGVVAPGYVTPWAAPGMPWKVLRHLLSRHAPVRFAGAGVFTQAPWLWRWLLACRGATYRANRSAMHALAHYSQQRLRALAQALQLDYERADGFMVLLRSPRDLAQAQASLQLLRELQVPFELLDADGARRVEPGLNPAAALHAAIRLPRDEVGNCRLFAHHAKALAQARGAQFRFGHEVRSVQPGTTPRLRWTAAAGPGEAEFDAVVVCAGHLAGRLLRPAGCKLPIAPIYGYSITAPLREDHQALGAGPRAAVMDERYKVAISRLGHRLRVAGSAEIGGAPQVFNAAALATLHKVLDDWFPGAAQLAKVQTWKGARPMLPDGPPAIGASGAPGVWLNVGHGSSGWALSCGSARVLADLLAGRSAAVDVSRFAPRR